MAIPIRKQNLVRLHHQVESKLIHLKIPRCRLMLWALIRVLVIFFLLLFLIDNLLAWLVTFCWCFRWCWWRRVAQSIGHVWWKGQRLASRCGRCHVASNARSFRRSQRSPQPSNSCSYLRLFGGTGIHFDQGIIFFLLITDSRLIDFKTFCIY